MFLWICIRKEAISAELAPDADVAAEPLWDEHSATLPTSTVIFCCLLCYSSPQGSELSGWSLGRWSNDGIDIHHNFPDLNTILWEAETKKLIPRKMFNHHVPIPHWYQLNNASVSLTVRSCLQLA